VYVGGWRRDATAGLNYLRHNGPEHILAFAPTRSGKGVGLVIPTLLGWEESTVVYDIKGENWAKTAGFRHARGHLCFKFSPVEDGNSSRFNPLGEVRLFTPRDVSDAQNIANMIVRTGEDSPQERYWQDAAASITTGMILHVCYEAAIEKRVACLADLSHVFTRPGSSFRRPVGRFIFQSSKLRQPLFWTGVDSGSPTSHTSVDYRRSLTTSGCSVLDSVLQILPSCRGDSIFHVNNSRSSRQRTPRLRRLIA
jgi:type IV secretory pathway TraG/TraD family ATPase VirD4